MYQVEGSFNGVAGRFEWITQSGNVTHRMFVPGRNNKWGADKTMIKIKDFIEIGFRISWTLLNMGFNGSEMFKKQIEGQDIINYAVNKMEEGEDSLDVVLLASTNATNDNEINELLFKLSNSETVDYDIEHRKWRVIYVSKHLPNEQVDYMQGLIELGDIWAMLDFPEDSPHVFQGRNNFMTPNEYYLTDSTALS